MPHHTSEHASENPQDAERIFLPQAHNARSDPAELRDHPILPNQVRLNSTEFFQLCTIEKGLWREHGAGSRI
jgi:hypothetical protein